MEAKAHRSSWLKKLYNQYNKRYWAGKLPDLEVGYMTTAQVSRYRIDKKTCAFTTFDDKVHTKPLAVIVILHEHKAIPHSKVDLLHEMCHVAKPRATHGKVFKQEVRRIAALGALDEVL